MAQTRQLLDALKRQLKAQGLTYRDVADCLDLSEASVKRLFAEQNFTLLRLEKICRQLGLELSELMQQALSAEHHVSELNWQQEQQIVADPQLLMITVCLVNGYQYDDLLEQYPLQEHAVIRHLATLDRLGIIELFPGNRVKLLLAPDFRWIANGPIQQLFQQKVVQDFFDSRFEADTEQLLVLNGLLSDTGNLELQQRLRRLAREFSAQCRAEAELPMDQRHGTTLVLALRQWQSSLFREFQNKP